MFREPDFKIARTPEEIADRVERMQKDYRVCRSLRRPDARMFAVKLNVLQSRLTPEEVDRRTVVGYTFELRTGAISEALWLYGYTQNEDNRDNLCYNAWEFRH